MQRENQLADSGDGMDDLRTKYAGQRRAGSGWERANILLHLVVRLRSGRPFIPKGVHRFRSFEEAHRWSVRMQAGKANPGHPL